MKTAIKYFLTICLFALPIIVSAKPKTVTITVNSRPQGATVYVDGREVGTTPCKVSLPGKWVYDIDANRVSDPNKPPYSKKFVFVLDGYKNATEYWEGIYEYHEAGIGDYRQQYYIVKPNGLSVMAFMEKE